MEQWDGAKKTQSKVITNSHVKACSMHLGRIHLVSANSWNQDNTPSSNSPSRAGSTLTPGSSQMSSSTASILDDSDAFSASIAVLEGVSKSPVPPCQKDLSSSCSLDPKPEFLLQSFCVNFGPHPAPGTESVYTTVPLET